jgi:hypothetical protein
MNENNQPKNPSRINLYEPHSGTIKVAGGTPHDGLAKSIVRLYETWLSGKAEFEQIDVTFFGMAAGYQAFRGINEAVMVIHSKFGRSIAFVPAMLKTRAIENKKVTEEIKDVSIWRMTELT